MIRRINHKKKTGSTFTPEALANFLAKRILYYSDGADGISVLDPACGNGILLSSFLNNSSHSNINLIGYDTNALCIDTTQKQLEDGEHKSICELHNDDFLTVSPNNIDLFNKKTRYEFADIVIANPPYVRTQILGAERANELAKDFNISGRIDLYYPFLMAMTNALKSGGILGVITSNRYLSTKSGADIRKYLRDNYEILEIIDLGDTKLFDAAVLPAIFIGKKKSIGSSRVQRPKYSSIYECDPSHRADITDAEDIFQILNGFSSGIFHINSKYFEYKAGELKSCSDKSDIWQLSDDKTKEVYEKIASNTAFKIKDKFKVRVGIKSCADNVFISRNWVKMGIKIEPQLLRPMLSQENITTWHIDSSNVVDVLYPHYSKGGKRMVYDISEFPEALRYLEHYKEQLTGRSYVIKANRNWYEYWVPQNPALWDFPKIVFPDISAWPRFCLDKSGAIVNGNCYWICAQSKEEERLLLLIAGVCNSSLMTKYHDSKFPNKLYSGRRRYLSQYIEEYPIPNPDSSASKRIIQLVNKIGWINDESKIKCISSEIDSLVEEAFGLRD